MSVIRTKSQEPTSIVEDVLRRELVRELQTQDEGDRPLRQPIVFQNEISSQDGWHVIVVWEKWRAVSVDVRPKIIAEAYESVFREHSRLLTANGMTTQEAIDLGLLPWKIEALDPSRLNSDNDFRQPFVDEGGVETPFGWELRFPDQRSAEAALQRLNAHRGTYGFWALTDTT